MARALEEQGAGLLVVDNLEQAVPAAREVLDALVAMAPSARLLATSREPLRARAEVVVRVEPLEPRGPAARDLLRALAPAVVAHTGAEDRLLDELGGLPLAIELAAARLDVLAVPDLADRLSRSLSVLALPGAEGRHGSLEATLASSWTQLSPRARRGLAWLSVFEHPFAAAAAEGVLAGVTPAPLDVLHELARKSLLALRIGPSAPLALLVPIRLFAAERLVEMAEERAAIDAYLSWYVREGEALRDAAREHGDRAALRALQLDLRDPMLRVATLCVEAAERVSDRDETGPTLAWRALRAVDVAVPSLQAERAREDVVALCTRALGEGARFEMLGIAYANALRHRCATYDLLGQREAGVRDARRLIELGEVLHDRRSLAAGYYELGAMTHADDPELADVYFEKAAATGEPLALPTVRFTQAFRSHVPAGRWEDAIACLREAVEAIERTQHALMRAQIGGYLAQALAGVGALAEAERRLGEACEAAEAQGARADAARYAHDLGCVLAELGRDAEALAAFERAEALAEGIRAPIAVLGALARVLLVRDASALEQALDPLSGSGPETRAVRAAIQLCLGRREAGAEDLAIYRKLGFAPPHRLEGEAVAAWFAVDAAARAARDLDPQAAADAWGVAREAVAEVDARGTPTGRFLLHLAARELAALPDPRSAWRVAADGSAAVGPDGARLDLAGRRALPEVLAALAARHASGDLLDVDAVFEAGWPGERAVHHAAANRVRVALSTLRKLGLTCLGDAEEGGWRLDPSAAVIVVPVGG